MRFFERLRLSGARREFWICCDSGIRFLTGRARSDIMPGVGQRGSNRCILRTKPDGTDGKDH